MTNAWIRERSRTVRMQAVTDSGNILQGRHGMTRQRSFAKIEKQLPPKFRKLAVNRYKHLAKNPEKTEAKIRM